VTDAFLLAAVVLLVSLVPLLFVIVTAEPLEGVVALELAAATVVLVLLCLSEHYHRSIYFNIPMIAAALFWIGSLVYARFFGRWL
jgi:multisubunit Na+/H+ antiporter MnhF subunit